MPSIVNQHGILKYHVATASEVNEIDYLAFEELSSTDKAKAKAALDKANAVVIAEITIFKNDNRGKGHGTALLNDFIKQATTEGYKNIILQAWPLMGLERGTEEDNPEWLKAQKRLIRWYKRHKFKLFDFAWMARCLSS